MNYPVIVVDEEHSGFARADGSDPPAYEIVPSAGIVLDASNYHIQVPPEYKVDGPNMIQLFLGKDRQFQMKWKPGVQRHVLGGATLTPRVGSQQFSGLHTGDTAIIAIGFDHTGITPGKDNTLSLMWLGMLKVK